MVRSFHYAVHNALFKEASVRPEDMSLLEPWTNLWYRHVSGIFLRSYLDTVRSVLFFPSDLEETEVMLKAYLLEKAVYELGYELNNRPNGFSLRLEG